jgi:competence protein ComGC
MLTIQFIISILMVLVLVSLIMNTIRKQDSVLRADVKRLRSENEALRKELLKRGIVEYV